MVVTKYEAKLTIDSKLDREQLKREIIFRVPYAEVISIRKVHDNGRQKTDRR